MKCCKCEISVMDAILYRMNEKGQKAIWACEDCHGEVEEDLKKEAHKINSTINNHLN